MRSCQICFRRFPRIGRNDFDLDVSCTLSELEGSLSLFLGRFRDGGSGAECRQTTGLAFLNASPCRVAHGVKGAVAWTSQLRTGDLVADTFVLLCGLFGRAG